LVAIILGFRQTLGAEFELFTVTEIAEVGRLQICHASNVDILETKKRSIKSMMMLIK